MKRILVFCDGTGKSSSRDEHSVPTNVQRFHDALLYSPDSITFFHTGIGTEDLGLVGFVKTYPQKLIDEIIADTYSFIMTNYRPGDSIFIFGFSRGAFFARVLANFVARFGVYKKPKSTSNFDFRLALKAYKGGTLDRDIEEGRIPKGDKVEIEVVGCWDTVASLGDLWTAGGVSGKYEHYSGALVKGIKHAFHALALDEYRRPFSPTMWFLPEDAPEIDLQQCWFPGVHANVGGGYDDQATADLAFAWMVNLCRPFLEFNQDYLDKVVDLHYNPSKLDRSSDRSPRLKVNGFHMEYQGWGGGRCYDSYRLGQTWSWKYRTPGAYGGYDEETNETIHPSVRARWQSSREKCRKLKDGLGVYAPEALRGFEPREGANGSWEWVKKEKGQEVLVISEASFPARAKLPNDPTSVSLKLSFEEVLRLAQD
ncbi:hypothetical protein GYMLUDRAFT_88233 [Collybiopsis luxurians FD-317 M1]|uniref:T6SS Phospholipase effector Tle1-like catalytic domain-containing protein n=1 Tax=Collybiopsis luxurians FD-317 M1 TaxID=944289 RepID=A0A0D0BH61_9AGAR|nr:hypothetical protein GYMLUDRAFT_88233 [Collybiopsis luxurians FD-317 M1]